jgi:hypothetical protein
MASLPFLVCVKVEVWCREALRELLGEVRDEVGVELGRGWKTAVVEGYHFGKPAYFW